MLGVIAVGAMAIYALYFFALIKLIPVVLTLPGIAGLILTLGVAADANIVIFERVKEEIRAGRSVMAGIATGYKKGLTAIIDANVVTIMVAFILFVLATAGVKGFALTLGLGVIVSLFTAVLATQAILGTMGKSRLINSPAMLGAAEKSKPNRFRLDYMGYSKWFFSASGMILVVCALALGANGINFGIDFESGTRVSVALAKNVDETAVRTVLAQNGQGNAKIQKVELKKGDKAASRFQISTENLAPAQVNTISDALKAKFGFGDTQEVNSIGPTFGQTVAKSAIIAIIASLLVISAYIALRFEPKYAVPVLIAVMHDILITAGVYALAGQEVTTATVAALLTILGFSLYDTIIVFDRIRENVPRMPRAAFSQIVNRSMSEVIVRSLATSFCSGLPVLRPAALRRRDADRVRVRAARRHDLGHVLLGLHRRPGADGMEGARAALPPPPRGDRRREQRRRARLRDRRRGARRRADAARAPPRPPDRAGRPGHAGLPRGVRGARARPARRRAAGAAAAARPPRSRRRLPPKPKPKRPEIDPAADALPEDVVMPDRPDGPAKPKKQSAAAKRRGKHGRPR